MARPNYSYYIWLHGKRIYYGTNRADFIRTLFKYKGLGLKILITSML